VTSLYFSRNEKLSRNNKRLLYSDGRNCPSVFLDNCKFLQYNYVDCDKGKEYEKLSTYKTSATDI